MKPYQIIIIVVLLSFGFGILISGINKELDRSLSSSVTGSVVDQEEVLNTGYSGIVLVNIGYYLLLAGLFLGAYWYFAHKARIHELLDDRLKRANNTQNNHNSLNNNNDNKK